MTNVEDVEIPAPSDKAARPAPMTLVAHDDDDDRAGREEYENLLKLYEGSFRNIAEGEVIKGTVLKVTSSEVVSVTNLSSSALLTSPPPSSSSSLKRELA